MALQSRGMQAAWVSRPTGDKPPVGSCQPEWYGQVQAMGRAGAWTWTLARGETRGSGDMMSPEARACHPSEVEAWPLVHGGRCS